MMSKRKRQGHFCRICHAYKANEKFSGKGHHQHICKACSRELQHQKQVRKRANKKALEAGLRPINKGYPKTARQAASYLQIDVDIFEDRCQKLGLVSCDTTEDGQDRYDIEAMIAVYQAIEA